MAGHSNKKLRAAFVWRLSQQGQSDYAQRLADSLPPEERSAIVIPDRPDDAEPQPWHDLYWRAWAALQHDRQIPAHGRPMPVSYLALSQYARDLGIAGDDFETFRILFAVLDQEWLQHIARVTPSPPPQT